MNSESEAGMEQKATGATEHLANNARKYGLGILILGVFLFYLSFYLPLQASSEGVESVTLYLKASVFGVAMIVVGVVLLLFGAKGAVFISPNPGNIGIGTVVFHVILVIVALASYSVLRHVVESRGYVLG